MLFSYFNVLWFSASKGGTSRPEGCPLPLHTETCSHKMEASWRKGAHPAKATPEDKWRRVDDPFCCKGSRLVNQGKLLQLPSYEAKRSLAYLRHGKTQS
ncbi:uncharacterized protein LOC103160880 [Cricetulus griseus]|uniref:Uncharacterized protein LOC103160880 n=1 Tax=Cricetulus griseus TaxID=10029 RepID=A0A9J7HFG6_CRIGR|nr:uncharacterized protein LOC103160880 [Cricetulus griseus]